MANTIAAVLIGRNEGERLKICLASVSDLDRVVYVDSGSTDNSVATARAVGAEVVELDMSVPFTAARARNAGIACLSGPDAPEFIQFVDGDCEMRPGWIAAALAFMRSNPKVAATAGRLRERFPQNSIYNRLCDREWDTPIGKTKACGGIALIRWTALKEVEGFNPTLIAGEEPEMCVRMRAKGWEIWRLNAEMALHDAAMTRFSQFWKRAERGGYAFAEGAAMHGGPPEHHGVTGLRRALLWGLVLPLAVLMLALVFGSWMLLALLIYPAQIVRLALRSGGGQVAWEQATLLTLGKFAEAKGVLTYWWRRLIGSQSILIEYK